MGPHNFPSRALESPYDIPDPGNGKAINPDRNYGVVPIVTAAAETRTITAPTKAGLVMGIAMKTDGGDCVITAPAAFNQAGNTTITLNDVGDMVELESYQHGSAFRWKLKFNDGAVLA